jgi:hypothetical protein
MVEMAWLSWIYLMSPAFTSHHGQNIARNAHCAERGATIFVSSVIASSCASHRGALRGGIPPVVEVFIFPPSCKIMCLGFSFQFFLFFLLQNIECSKSTLSFTILFSRFSLYFNVS